MSYWRVLRTEPRFLAFGFLMAFFSSFGQTFFIALFSAELRADFNLQRAYTGPAGSLIWLYLGYYGTDRGGRPEHTPRGCYTGAGWGIEQARTFDVRGDGTFMPFAGGLARDELDPSERETPFDLVRETLEAADR